MGQIYRNAEKVITYIGPAEEDEEEEKGMALMNLLYSHFLDNYGVMFQAENINLLWQRRSELPVVSLPAELDDTGVDKYIKLGWRWLCRVAFGEWTRRLWIVQEQLLNIETVMLRGSQLLSWEIPIVMNLLFFLEFLPVDYATRLCEEELKQPHADIDDASRSVFSMWHHRRLMLLPEGDAEFASLLTNLGYYEMLQCRNPRDRIFAILAISEDAEQLKIQPDYSAAVEKVFLDV